jgi:hypothetical protein
MENDKLAILPRGAKNPLVNVGVIAKNETNCEGVGELGDKLERIRNRMRTNQLTTHLEPREKPLGMIAIADTTARHIARCHEMADDIEAILYAKE